MTTEDAVWDIWICINLGNVDGDDGTERAVWAAHAMRIVSYRVVGQGQGMGMGCGMRRKEGRSVGVSKTWGKILGEADGWPWCGANDEEGKSTETPSNGAMKRALCLMGAGVWTDGEMDMAQDGMVGVLGRREELGE